MTEATEETEAAETEQAQSRLERAMCGVISFMTGIATGMIANWLALQSPKPQDHILVSLIVGGMIAGITMFLLVDSPNEI